MKRDTGLWIAGALGVAAAIGIFALRKYLESGDYGAYYNDYHKLFFTNDDDERHGVEFWDQM